jgi:hypothetical protein
MRRLISLLFLSGCCITANAGDDDLFPSLSFPTKKIAVEVTTQSVREEVIESVEAGRFYILTSEGGFGLVSEPEGIATIQEFNGDGKKSFVGVFADGDGSIESRTYDAKFCYLVIGHKPGTCKLIGAPYGFTSMSEFIRQPLTITGTGPRPPPDPDPIDPDPPAPRADHVRTIFLEDTRSPDAAILFNALHGWAAYSAAGNSYRIVNKNAQDEEAANAEAELIGIPLPAMLVIDKDTGKVIHKGKLPATFADLQKLIGGLTNGN